MEESKPAKPVILVVDDETLLRLNAAELLEEDGYSVIEAANADDALKIIESHPDIRLLFTDLRMPGRLDGMDLAREVHARWPNIRLIITSGHTWLNRDEIPDDGRFIPKPYRIEDLTGQVHELVGRGR